MITLKDFLLKSDFLNKNVLITEVSFCAKISASVGQIFFSKKGSLLRCIVCVIEKRMSNRLDAITTTTQRIKRILKIMFQFVLFKMANTGSKIMREFDF